jgi:hypothetical protein
MIFHLLINNEITKQKFELLPNMDKFFLSHALTKNGELIKYATNYENWVNEYKNNWKEDPIVAAEHPIKAKFRISEWILPIKSPKQRQFYELRQQLTGASYGISAFKASASPYGKITEFYAIGSTDEFPISQSLIFDPVFVRFALQHLFKMFNKQTQYNFI